ncbi:MAG: CBS domain-containing protein [Anaeromyxobacter sp.]
MISVGDVMTRDLVTVQETDDVALAESLLKMGRFRHLPVVRDGQVVGLVTARDILRAGLAGRPAARGVHLAEIMTRDPVTVAPRASLVSAARTMLDQKYGCLPVCEPGGDLVGILTEADFVRFAADVVHDLDLVSEAVHATASGPAA